MEEGKAGQTKELNNEFQNLCSSLGIVLGLFNQERCDWHDI
jgi:hypothetical protein